MKKVIYLFIFFFIELLAITHVKASWMEGAEFGWTCIGQDSFLIKLTLYSDCDGSAPYQVPIYFKCLTNGATITTLNIAVNNSVDVTPIGANCCNRCKSSSCSFPYGMRRNILEKMVVLSGAGSYCQIRMSWEQSTRSPSLTTINSSGIYFYTEAILNRCQNPCYSSPEFTNAPIGILCVGQDYTIDFGESNNSSASTDSFSYELTQPLESAGNPVTYTGQYDYDKPIYFWGFPTAALPWPRGIHLDPLTGQIQFRPMKNEVTVMTIKINVFRNSVKIAELRRESFYIVISCASNSTPQIHGYGNKYVCAGDTVKFDFTSSDADSNDTVSLSWDKSIQGAVWVDSNGLKKCSTARFTWVPPANKANQTISFYITAKDNGCPLNKSSKQLCRIFVRPGIKGNIIADSMGCGTYEFHLDSSYTNNYTYSLFTQGQNHTLGPLNNYNFDTPGRYQYTITVQDGNYCSKSDTGTIYINSSWYTILPADTAICTGSMVKIIPKIVNYSGKIRYLWNYNNDTNSILQTSGINKNLQVILTVEDSMKCSKTDTMQVIMGTTGYLEAILPNDTTVCFGGRLRIIPQINKNKGWVKYQWSTGDTSGVLQSGSFTSDNTLYLWVHDSTGCSSTANMKIKVVKNGPVKVTLPADTSICTGNKVQIIPQVAQNKGKVYFNWSTGDTTEILLTGRIYLDTIISLTVRDSMGCMANDNMKISIDNNGLLKVVLPGDRGICTGTVMSIVPKLIQSKGIVKYHWSNGDTRDILQTGPINSNTTIYLWVQDSTGCMANDKIQLYVLQIPWVMQVENSVICHDSTITFEPAYKCYGSQNDMKSVKWQMAGDTTTISTQKYLNVHDSGLYVFSVTDKYGCTGSDMIKVGVSPKVDTVLQVKGSELILAPGMKLYTWYRNYIFYYTTTSNSYQVSRKGNYYAILTNNDDCKAQTRSVNIDPSGINDRNVTGGFVIYPNPTTGKLMLESNEPLTGDLGLLITNMYGGTILNQTFKANDLQTVKEIDISDQPAGTYTVIICYQNSNFHQLIIKE